MHYCLMLFTKKELTEDEIEKLLEKYQDENISEGEYPQLEWDWYEIGGRWENLLEVNDKGCNMAFISDVQNFNELDCYTFMTADKDVYSYKWWNGHNYIQNEDFEERLKSAKDKAKAENQFVTIIDYHD